MYGFLLVKGEARAGQQGLRLSFPDTIRRSDRKMPIAIFRPLHPIDKQA
jgi:hypothetical protein